MCIDFGQLFVIKISAIVNTKALENCMLLTSSATPLRLQSQTKKRIKTFREANPNEISFYLWYFFIGRSI